MMYHVDGNVLNRVVASSMLLYHTTCYYSSASFNTLGAYLSSTFASSFYLVFVEENQQSIQNLRELA